MQPLAHGTSQVRRGGSEGGCLFPYCRTILLLPHATWVSMPHACRIPQGPIYHNDRVSAPLLASAYRCGCGCGCGCGCAPGVGVHVKHYLGCRCWYRGRPAEGRPRTLTSSPDSPRHLLPATSCPPLPPRPDHLPATRSSVELAAQQGLASLSFPGISTGVFGYPWDKAAQVRARPHGEGSATQASTPPTAIRGHTGFGK